MDRIERGRQAQILLEHPLFREAMDGLDAQYHASWRVAKTVEAREDLYRYVKVLERITEDLQLMMQDGELEKARLKELEDRKGMEWPWSS